MSKRRKTRQQKIIAELRHQIASQTEPKLEKPSVKNTFSLSNIPTSTENATSVYSPTHSYLIHDLKTISILTTSIIAIQFFLFFLLKNHLIQIPGMSY